MGEPTLFPGRNRAIYFRCTHRECHVPATRIVGYQDSNGVLRRGYTCGNHNADKPTGRPTSATRKSAAVRKGVPHD